MISDDRLAEPTVLGTLESDSGSVSTDVVPTAFTVTRPKKDPELSLRDPKTLEAMRNKEVIVHANAVEYRGTLLGCDGEEVFLRTELRYVSVLLERVSRVELQTQKLPPLDNGILTESFLNADDDDHR